MFDITVELPIYQKLLYVSIGSSGSMGISFDHGTSYPLLHLSLGK